MYRKLVALGAALLLGAALAAPAGATNGMDMIGYGTRSIGMGGADVAVAGDAGSVSGNPAAVTQATPASFTIGITELIPALDLTHDPDTAMGPAPVETIDGETQYFSMPMLGYVRRSPGSALSWGFGLYAQGGMGVDFQDVNTGMGTKDELSSQVSFLRFNPLVGYQATENLSLGVTLLVGYSQAEFSVFPETFVPDANPMVPGDQPFGGMDITGLSSFGFAGRVGAQYQLGPMVRLGVTYTSEATIELDGGTAEFNFGPMGKVKYDAELQEFTWPQEVEAGVAVSPVEGLTIAADVKWLNWSAVVDQPLLKVSNPPAGYPSKPFPDAQGNPMSSDGRVFDMAWEDQWVYALGVEYVIGGIHALRAGYNYGKSPVPDDKLNPLFPAIVEHHVTAGYGLTLGKWVVDLAYEHGFENSQVNDKTQMEGNDFGAGLEVSHAQNTFSVGVTYHF